MPGPRLPSTPLGQGSAAPGSSRGIESHRSVCGAATADAARLGVRFPDVRFIVAHAGAQHFAQAAALAETRPNVWLDTSSYFVTPAELRRLLVRPGPGKLVFGSDVPVMATDPAEALAKIMALPLSAPERDAVNGVSMTRTARARRRPGPRFRALGVESAPPPPGGGDTPDPAQRDRHGECAS